MPSREPRHRILVVDDEPRMIRFIQMNLELEGYQVSQANNGFEALTSFPAFADVARRHGFTADDHRPDLVGRCASCRTS